MRNIIQVQFKSFEYGSLGYSLSGTWASLCSVNLCILLISQKFRHSTQPQRDRMT